MQRPKVLIVLRWRLRLYNAFSKAKKNPVVCFAHLTNSMAQQNGDFEKGAENGSLTSLELIFQTAKLLMPNEN
jgi:hypothetical protein